MMYLSSIRMSELPTSDQDRTDRGSENAKMYYPTFTLFRVEDEITNERPLAVFWVRVRFFVAGL